MTHFCCEWLHKMSYYRCSAFTPKCLQLIEVINYTSAVTTFWLQQHFAVICTQGVVAIHEHATFVSAQECQGTEMTVGYVWYSGHGNYIIGTWRIDITVANIKRYIDTTKKYGIYEVRIQVGALSMDSRRKGNKGKHD